MFAVLSHFYILLYRRINKTPNPSKLCSRFNAQTLHWATEEEEEKPREEKQNQTERINWFISVFTRISYKSLLQCIKSVLEQKLWRKKHKTDYCQQTGGPKRKNHWLKINTFFFFLENNCWHKRHNSLWNTVTAVTDSRCRNTFDS